LDFQHIDAIDTRGDRPEKTHVLVIFSPTQVDSWTIGNVNQAGAVSFYLPFVDVVLNMLNVNLSSSLNGNKVWCMISTRTLVSIVTVHFVPATDSSRM
jgi:hypothetical protein